MQLRLPRHLLGVRRRSHGKRMNKKVRHGAQVFPVEVHSYSDRAYVLFPAGPN